MVVRTVNPFAHYITRLYSGYTPCLLVTPHLVIKELPHCRQNYGPPDPMSWIRIHPPPSDHGRMAGMERCWLPVCRSSQTSFPWLLEAFLAVREKKWRISPGKMGDLKDKKLRFHQQKCGFNSQEYGFDQQNAGFKQRQVGAPGNSRKPNLLPHCRTPRSGWIHINGSFLFWPGCVLCWGVLGLFASSCQLLPSQLHYRRLARVLFNF